MKVGIEHNPREAFRYVASRLLENTPSEDSLRETLYTLVDYGQPLDTLTVARFLRERVVWVK